MRFRALNVGRHAVADHPERAVWRKFGDEIAECRGVRLFDAGFVTVTPDYRFKVSDRLREEYANGRIYYELQARPLMVLPEDPSKRPSVEALNWHARHVFEKR